MRLEFKPPPFVTRYRSGGDAVRAYVQKQMNELFKDCVRIFINTVLDAIRNDIDTGMSAATLLPLAAHVGLKSKLFSEISDSRKHVQRGGYKGRIPDFPVLMSRKKKRGQGTTGIKNMAHGIALGDRAYTFKVTDQRWQMSFKIRVSQYFIHEYGLAGVHFWDSLRKGEEAFIGYWKANKMLRLDKSHIYRLMKGQS